MWKKIEIFDISQQHQKLTRFISVSKELNSNPGVRNLRLQSHMWIFDASILALMVKEK